MELWKRNKQTKVVDELDFSWSVNSVKDWHKKAIYHNAGVTNSSSGMFYKGIYMKSLPALDLQLDTDKCSYNYYNLIKMTLA